VDVELELELGQERKWKKGRRRGRLSETMAELAPPPRCCVEEEEEEEPARPPLARVSHDAPSAAFRTTDDLPRPARARQSRASSFTRD
jgi:hypothetical protein